MLRAGVPKFQPENLREGPRDFYFDKINARVINTNVLTFKEKRRRVQTDSGNSLKT